MLTVYVSRGGAMSDGWNDILRVPLRPMSMRRSMQYGFPEMTIEPGEERSASVEVKGIFRGEKLTMVAFMKPAGGGASRECGAVCLSCGVQVCAGRSCVSWHGTSTI